MLWMGVVYSNEVHYDTLTAFKWFISWSFTKRGIYAAAHYGKKDKSLQYKGGCGLREREYNNFPCNLYCIYLLH